VPTRGRIATSQDRALAEVRAARNNLRVAEKALVDGRFRTAEQAIEAAKEALGPAAAAARNAYDGMVETQRPTG
jgi:hypothetical protein